MSENGKKKNVDQCFPKSKMMSSNVLFSPQPKDIQFTVIEEERNLKIFTFKKKSTRLSKYLVINLIFDD